MAIEKSFVQYRNGAKGMVKCLPVSLSWKDVLVFGSVLESQLPWSDSPCLPLRGCPESHLEVGIASEQVQ